MEANIFHSSWKTVSWMSLVEVMDLFPVYQFRSKSFVHTLPLTAAWQSLGGRVNRAWMWMVSWENHGIFSFDIQLAEYPAELQKQWLQERKYTEDWWKESYRWKDLTRVRCLGWAPSSLFQRRCGEISYVCSLTPGDVHTCCRHTRQQFCDLPLPRLFCCCHLEINKYF